jgi:hypothetical protein
MKNSHWLLIIGLALLLVGCINGKQVGEQVGELATLDAPTAIVESTIISPSPLEQALPAISTSTVPTPETITTAAPLRQTSGTQELSSPAPSATFTPSATPTQDPFPDIPESPIRIFSPGEASRVTSPIPVDVDISPLWGGEIILELRGEDGRLLVRHLYSPGDTPNFHLTINLVYEIGTPSEMGRLLVLTKDEFGRLTDLNSLDLTLLSAGNPSVDPGPFLKQVIVIQEPNTDEPVEGGTLAVSGVVRAGITDVLRVHLVDERGKVVGQRLAGLDYQASQGYIPFSAEVPYKVDEPTPVRLVVYAGGMPRSEIMHLSSIEILLNP